MKVYGTKEIRNVGIVGHGDVGKTSLVAAMLFDAGATNRLGRVDEGTTVTDYDEDEIARKITIHSSLAHCEWNGNKINITDTPGYAAFILDSKAGLRACDAAARPRRRGQRRRSPDREELELRRRIRNSTTDRRQQDGSRASRLRAGRQQHQRGVRPRGRAGSDSDRKRAGTSRV